MSKTIGIVFPHQLFRDSKLIDRDIKLFLVEEYLFFRQFSFHKQKLVFHRSTMKYYHDYLCETKEVDVEYIDAHEPLADIRCFIEEMQSQGVTNIVYYDPIDDWLHTRLRNACLKASIQTECLESPLFLCSNQTLSNTFDTKLRKVNQTSFYIKQRKALNVLLHEDHTPLGGKWTFDSDNRKKYPKNKIPPSVQYPENCNYYTHAIEYVESNFSSNLGEVSKCNFYPLNFDAAQEWFTQFLNYRFYDFGVYEDAIVKGELLLNHSLLSPLMNVGLLQPQQVVSQSIEFAEKNNIPINSTEGFIRQIIGWREFIRGVYVFHGSYERTMNFWNFSRKIPPSFYTGSTGIEPVDETIRQVIKTGYCHHIERLMVLGNFMLLCEFDPNEIYRWFMELFIDAYDWVMVPNVFGMSQFADGGLMSTKPYISGSNYILKMSNYQKSDWVEIWDGLFWRFLNTHRLFFLSNPRLGMLVRMFDKMPQEKQQAHLKNAEKFLYSLET